MNDSRVFSYPKYSAHLLQVELEDFIVKEAKNEIENEYCRPSKERKGEFLMFTKVLMKYLEQKDQSMHACAKEVIRDCAKKNKEGNPAYSCLSISMQSHLKNLVGGTYWKKAEKYLQHYRHAQYVKKGVPREEAKRKANATAQSAASSLALDMTVPPSASDLPVGRLVSSGHSLFSQRNTAALPLALGVNNNVSSIVISSLPVGYPSHSRVHICP